MEEALDPARIPAYMRCMQNGAAELKTRRETPLAALAGKSRGGVILVASILLHLLLLAPLLVFLTPPPPQSEPVESVSVELVPPPESPPEPEAEPQEQAQAEPPPAPQAAPEPPPVEEPQAEPVPPAAEQPVEAPPAEEPAAEEPQAPAEAEPDLPAGAAAPIPVLRPVVQFGEEDRGSDLSHEGAVDGDPDGDVAVTDETAEPDASAEEAEAEDEPGNAVPELALPEAEAAGNGAQDAPIETLSPSGESISVSAEEVKQASLKPREVRRLFSTAISDDAMAMTAMGMMSRQERGDQLCGTELSQQLRHGRPAYEPYLLPRLRIGEGTVADAPLTGFQDTNGQWFNIAVRCEVDADATRVIDFSLSIGAPVPRAEWQARGFPAR
ncbi:DUF930 domain-containing protein [Rhizobium sp. G187]|uniref:DUF930 domain-containing protein n=1 Tax=Rhizobium sp. G187 TaxID=3451352 RepID=UPI003EE5B7D5